MSHKLTMRYRCNTKQQIDLVNMVKNLAAKVPNVFSQELVETEKEEYWTKTLLEVDDNIASCLTEVYMSNCASFPCHICNVVFLTLLSLWAVRYLYLSINLSTTYIHALIFQMWFSDDFYK